MTRTSCRDKEGEGGGEGLPASTGFRLDLCRGLHVPSVHTATHTHAHVIVVLLMHYTPSHTVSHTYMICCVTGPTPGPSAPGPTPGPSASRNACDQVCIRVCAGVEMHLNAHVRVCMYVVCVCVHIMPTAGRSVCTGPSRLTQSTAGQQDAAIRGKKAGMTGCTELDSVREVSECERGGRGGGGEGERDTVRPDRGYFRTRLGRCGRWSSRPPTVHAHSMS